MTLADAKLFPLLTDAGDRMLRRLRQHPHAPRYNHRIGERLSAEGLANVRGFAITLDAPTPWNSQRTPTWLPHFVARQANVMCHSYRQPIYAKKFLRPSRIDARTIHRRRQPWDFVPDTAPLDDLIVYTTSGTTGASLVLPAHPEVPNRYLPLFEHALAAHGVKIEGGQERISIIQVYAQDKTVTNCTIMSYFNGRGLCQKSISIPTTGTTPTPADPIHFLNDCDPEIFTGDPFSFHTLMQLPLRIRPKALLSLCHRSSPPALRANNSQAALSLPGDRRFIP